MDEGIDFIKIKDYAVININNMIPVPDSEFSLVLRNGNNSPLAKRTNDFIAMENNKF